MQFQAQLLHAEPGRFVVQVSGWSGEHCLGSTLGQADNAETAEERALARLQQRLATNPPTQVSSPGLSQAGMRVPDAEAKISPGAPTGRTDSKGPSLPGPQAKLARPQSQASPLPAALSPRPGPTAAKEETKNQGNTAPNSRPTGAASAAQPLASGHGGSEQSTNAMTQLGLGDTSPRAESMATSERHQTNATKAGASNGQPADPEDWSDELAALEIQLQRLGWQRDEEAIYLQRAYGHPSRSRLTSYGDLVAYLSAMRQLEAPADPASVAVPLRRADLLAQSDELLSQLGWDANRGREVLETFFQCASRQQLNDELLLQFNMVLEGELINSKATTPA